MSIRQDREKDIVQLYREGKSYREIARIARISLRDIKPILQKYGANNKISDLCSDETDIYFGLGNQNKEEVYVPNSTKAYKLFAEGKNPYQVSIALNLRAPEVQILFKEFWELRRMHSLSRLYDEIRDQGVSSLLQLHKTSKAQQISNDQVIIILRLLLVISLQFRFSIKDYKMKYMTCCLKSISSRQNSMN